jgi:hypothetical protein
MAELKVPWRAWNSGEGMLTLLDVKEKVLMSLQQKDEN